jgi:uncharacterized protein YkwD
LRVSWLFCVVASCAPFPAAGSSAVGTGTGSAPPYASSPEPVVEGRSTFPLLGQRERYATERGEGAPFVGPQADTLASGFSRSWAARGAPPLEGDHRLAELAVWLAKCHAAQLPISAQLVTFGAEKLGIPFSDPFAIAVSFDPHSPAEEFAAQLSPLLEGLPHNRPFARYGVGVVRDGSRMAGTVVVSGAEVSFEPLPRRLRTGEELRLAGTLGDRFDHAHLAVTMPDGKVQSFEAAGRRFEGRVLVQSSGVYRVELLGDGNTGPVVVANFSVYVDVDEPNAPRQESGSPLAARTGAQIEEALLRRVNDERAHAGLPPVASFDPLAIVAHAHSQDMADHGFFGHVSPTTGTTDDRVRQSGIPVIGYGEDLSKGADVEAVHQQLMASPAHRAIILDPRFTRVGIGVVVQGGASSSIIATELFGQFSRPVDPTTGAADVLEQLNMKRLPQSLASVRAQPDLQKAAELGLELRARDPRASVEAIAGSIAVELKRRARALARAGIRGSSATVIEARSIDDVVERPELYAPRLTHVGVAVAGVPEGGVKSQLVILVLGFGR